MKVIDRLTSSISATCLAPSGFSSFTTSVILSRRLESGVQLQRRMCACVERAPPSPASKKDQRHAGALSTNLHKKYNHWTQGNGGAHAQSLRARADGLPRHNLGVRDFVYTLGCCEILDVVSMITVGAARFEPA